MVCFRRICLILQKKYYRVNEKYVLVLVQCHDGIITNSINLFLRLTLIFDSCKTKQIYLVRDNHILTLDSNQNLIILQSEGANRLTLDFLQVENTNKTKPHISTNKIWSQTVEINIEFCKVKSPSNLYNSYFYH